MYSTVNEQTNIAAVLPCLDNAKSQSENTKDKALKYTVIYSEIHKKHKIMIHKVHVTSCIER